MTDDTCGGDEVEPNDAEMLKGDGAGNVARTSAIGRAAAINRNDLNIGNLGPVSPRLLRAAYVDRGTPTALPRSPGAVAVMVGESFLPRLVVGNLLLLRLHLAQWYGAVQKPGCGDRCRQFL